MQPVNVIEEMVGNTLKVTWVNSGVTPGAISSALYDRNEFLVNSIAATSSLNGFYYALHTIPTSYIGFYVNEWKATINAQDYFRRQYIRAQRFQAD